MSQSLVFQLAIEPEQLLRLYRGSVRVVQTTTTTGQRLRFPAERLRPFVEHDGVHGTFRITFDRHERFVSLERL